MKAQELSTLQKNTGASVTVLVGVAAGKEAQVAPVVGAKEKGKLRVRYRRHPDESSWLYTWLAPREFEVRKQRSPLFALASQPPTPPARQLQRLLSESGVERGPGWSFSEAECAAALAATGGCLDAAYGKLIDGRHADDARPKPTGLRRPSLPGYTLVQASNCSHDHVKVWMAIERYQMPPTLRVPAWFDPARAAVRPNPVLVLLSIESEYVERLGRGVAVPADFFVHKISCADESHCNHGRARSEGHSENGAHAHVFEGEVATPPCENEMLFDLAWRAADAPTVRLHLKVKHAQFSQLELRQGPPSRPMALAAYMPADGPHEMFSVRIERAAGAPPLDELLRRHVHRGLSACSGFVAQRGIKAMLAAQSTQ